MPGRGLRDGGDNRPAAPRGRPPLYAGHERGHASELGEETKLLSGLHPRFQRVVRFAPATGCRLEEIRGIDPKPNIDWVRGTVYAVGTFAKERDVPMQPDAKAALKQQLDAEGKLRTQNQQRLREVLAEGAKPPATSYTTA
jgi:integrase